MLIKTRWDPNTTPGWWRLTHHSHHHHFHESLMSLCFGFLRLTSQSTIFLSLMNVLFSYNSLLTNLRFQYVHYIISVIAIELRCSTTAHKWLWRRRHTSRWCFGHWIHVHSVCHYDRSISGWFRTILLICTRSWSYFKGIRLAFLVVQLGKTFSTSQSSLAAMHERSVILYRVWFGLHTSAGIRGSTVGFFWDLKLQIFDVEHPLSDF